MKELVNSFDKEVSFTNLEDAKKYYYPSAEDDNQTKSSETFLESQASSRNISNSGMNTRTL